jgi:hypothetical protein
MSAKPALVAAAVGAALAATLTLPAARALEKPGTVQITDAETKHTHLDAGKRGTSIGDLDVYSMALFNKRITPKSIGHGAMVCTRVGTKRQSCTANYVLPRGEIAVQGTIDSRLIYELAVVGGSGLYNNVRGTLTVTSLDRKPNRELLVFRLVV